MTDYFGMRHKLWRAIWEHAGKAIDEVLKEAWRDGYDHGFQDGYDRARGSSPSPVREECNL
ncbi:MAG: hypothetical protein JRE40_13065 [Deltaproteobacteria bacterium]|nr:hypothetical protein [Deltaproteobacteria bacterium]